MPASSAATNRLLVCRNWALHNVLMLRCDRCDADAVTQAGCNLTSCFVLNKISASRKNLLDILS
jgi:hypothetical protein